MDLVIRHVKEQDHEAVHETLTSPHVLSGSMRVPLAPLQQTRERLNPARGISQLVAEAEDRVVGFGELIPSPDEPRHRHAGEINMVASKTSAIIASHGVAGRAGSAWTPKRSRASGAMSGGGARGPRRGGGRR